MKKIYHLHIPKTGGTTVNSLLESHFPKHRIMSGTYWDEVRQEVMDAGEWNGFDSFPFDRMFADHDLICSHMNYTKYVPDAFFTLVFLRDPIDRVVSQYNDWARLRDSDIAHNPDIVAGQKRRAWYLPLDRFIQDAERHLTLYYFRNGMCKTFLGERVKACLLNNPEIYTQDRLYSEAKEVMDSIDFIGFLSTLDESVKTLYEKLGWGSIPKVPHLNKASTQKSQVLEYDEEIVRSYQQADIRLYDYAIGAYGLQ